MLCNEVTDKGNFEQLVAKVHGWNERKRDLMTKDFIQIAYKRLMEYSEHLF